MFKVSAKVSKKVTRSHHGEQGSPNRLRPVSTVKKTVGKPVKPAGLLLLKKYRHGLLVGTGPIRVPGRTGSTGNRPNRSGSQRFG
jgi:hypothetical protein